MTDPNHGQTSGADAAGRAVSRQMRALRAAGAGGDPARPDVPSVRGQGMPPPVALVAIASVLERLCAAEETERTPETDTRHTDDGQGGPP